MTQQTYAIRAADVSKSFGDLQVINDVNLTVQSGTVFALLGPNGAGKTTLVRILATLLKQNKGTVLVNNYDTLEQTSKVRATISMTGQFTSIDNDLTGYENLYLIARLQGYSRPAAKKRATQLLDTFGLKGARKRQARTYSGGMKRRLDIAASIVVTPEVLFLDEPTTGLDPRSRKQVWNIIRQLVAGGTTVVLTTQYLEEADQLADRIAVIDKGVIVAEGTNSELKASVGATTLRVHVVAASDVEPARKLLEEVLGTNIQPDTTDPTALTARLHDTQKAGPALTKLTGAGIGISSFVLGQPSLDDVFLALTDQPNTRSTKRGATNA